MSASPKHNAFMLSSATLMIAKFGTLTPFELTPALHSVGLSKEISVILNSSEIDLMAGVSQAIVDSQRSNVQAQITGSVHEYTAENLMRAQSRGDTTVTPKRGVLAADLASAAVSMTLTSDPMPGEASSALTVAGDIPSGATILIQSASGQDYVFPTRASAIATLSGGTFTVPIAGAFAIPAGMSFKAGDSVWIISEMEIGSTDDTDFFAVKVAGTLSNFNRPVVALFPKVQVTKGFTLTFSETAYGAMPWEMRPLLLTAAEATGRLAEIGTKASGRVYAA